MKKLFDNKTDYFVLAFIVGLFLMLGFCEAQADPSVEINHDSNGGITDYNSGYDRVCGRWLYANESTSMYVCPFAGTRGQLQKGNFELGLGEKFGRWEGDIRLAYVREQTWGGATVRRVVGDGPFQMFLGASYWVTESPGTNSQVTFNLGMRYTWQ